MPRRYAPARRYAPTFLPMLCVCVLLSGGCESLPGGSPDASSPDTTRAPGVPPPGEGLVTVATGRSVSAATAQLKSALQSSGATLVAEIDHAQNAASAGDSLRPMQLLVFGSPALGTPLMQSVQTAGLDLPQKMLVWQGADDSTRITYNMPAYLAARHDLSGVSASLNEMGRSLASLAEQAAGRMPDTSAFNADSISAAAGLAVEASDFGSGETFRRLRDAVQSRPGLSAMTAVNHSRNARGDSLGGPTTEDSTESRANAGVPGNRARLSPTRLLLFGNPEAGTPLMQQTPTLGIDLPQKILVWEDEAENTFLAYNEPAYLARRHALTDTTGLERIAGMLQTIASEATSDETERREMEEARTDSSGVSY